MESRDKLTDNCNCFRLQTRPHMSLSKGSSGVAGWTEQEKGETADPKFLAVEKCSSKNTKLRAKTPHLGKFRGKIIIFSTLYFFHRKFAIVCRNSVGNLRCPPENCNLLSSVFFNPQRRYRNGHIFCSRNEIYNFPIVLFAGIKGTFITIAAEI